MAADSYDILVTVTDKLDNSSVQKSIATAAVFMHWSKTGVGIGKFHENGRLDVAGDILSSGKMIATGDVYSNGALLLPAASDSETLSRTIVNKAVTPKSLFSSSDTKVLWTGGLLMTGGHTAMLSELVTDQRHGIILVWSGYSSGTVRDYSWVYTYIPKAHVERHPGAGINCTISTPLGTDYKYIYVNNNSLTGNDRNTGTAIVDNKVLREVLGW